MPVRNLKWGLLGYVTVEGQTEKAAFHASPSLAPCVTDGLGWGNYSLLPRDEPNLTSLPAANQNNTHPGLVRPHSVKSQSEERAEPKPPKAPTVSGSSWESMAKSQASSSRPGWAGLD